MAEVSSFKRCGKWSMRTASRTILTRISFGELLICWACRLDGVWSFVERCRLTGRSLKPVTCCRNHRRSAAAVTKSHDDARVWSVEGDGAPGDPSDAASPQIAAHRDRDAFSPY